MNKMEVEEDEKSEQEQDPWIPLRFTHVEYKKGDFIGLFFALSSLGPMTLMSSCLTLAIFRRDLHTITFLIGMVLNEPINLFLKCSIKESRPNHRDYQYGGNYMLYGMPSSHSQHLWFFAVYTILFVYIRLEAASYAEHTGLSILVTIVASLTAYGRVYLKFHTWKQVLVGCVVGMIYACVWFTATQLIFTPIFPTIVSWEVSKYFLIRDTTNIPHLLSFEYYNVMNELNRTGELV